MNVEQVSEITYQEIFQKALSLISRSEKARKDLIVANFELGGLVSQIQDSSEYGDNAVVKLAEDLTKAKNYQVTPVFLWECARVYRTFKGNLQRVWQLEKELQLRGIQISWRFLVRNCTPLPEPEKVLEAEAYWEKQMTDWETTISEVEETIEKKDEVIEKMPPKAKEAFESFVMRVSRDNAIKVNLNSSDKLEEALKRLEKAIDILSEIEPENYDERVRKILFVIKEKIEKIIEKI